MNPDSTSPAPTNQVHVAAAAFRAMILAEGEPCGDIAHSYNRHQEASSYFDALGGRIRVSDHHANRNFRVNELHVFFEHATAEKAAALVAAYRSARQDAASASSAAAASQDAYEAPFIARFRAAGRDHEREAILREAYPGLYRPGVGKQQRADMLKRFRGATLG